MHSPGYFTPPLEKRSVMKNVEGVFSKKQRAKIKLWVTDDERRLLVQMKSKAMVGSFVAELVSVEGHDLLTISNLKESN